MMAIGMADPARPDAHAVTVPSPPVAMTTSAPASAAALAWPWPGSSGVVSSHSGSAQPCSVMAPQSQERNGPMSSNFVGLTTTAARFGGSDMCGAYWRLARRR